MHVVPGADVQMSARPYGHVLVVCRCQRSWVGTFFEGLHTHFSVVTTLTLPSCFTGVWDASAAGFGPLQHS